MTVERTFSIIKPDAVGANNIGAILGRFEQAGLRVVAMKMVHLSRDQAEGFYAVHRERPFFGFRSFVRCYIRGWKCRH